jgi:hypothetical protein
MTINEMIQQLEELRQICGDAELHTRTEEGDDAPITIALEGANCITFYL